MTIKLIRGTPTGKTTVRGFACRGKSGGGYFEEEANTYTPSAGARRFVERRAELNLLARDAAKRVGLTTTELLGLEWGELVPADEGDWSRLMAALEVERG